MSSSAEIVAHIEELLRQILLSVPALSLIRFKTVSKQWLSLISDPEFRRRHTLKNPNPKPTAFFPGEVHGGVNNIVDSVTLAGNPFKPIFDSVPDVSAVKILQSCNGLFLCSVQKRSHSPLSVYVINPTTNVFKAVSVPRLEKTDKTDVLHMRYALAFDPSRSPYYTVVCVTNQWYLYQETFLIIDVYSSQTGTWVKHITVPLFPRPMDFNSRNMEEAVYCNGVVHWTRRPEEVSLRFRTRWVGDILRKKFIRARWDVIHYYDIAGETLRLVSATPPVPKCVQNTMLGSEDPCLSQRYFGESCGRLYLIDIFRDCPTQFEVLEMERDYSGWSVKYNIDLNPVFDLHEALPSKKKNLFVVMGFFGEEGRSDEDSSTEVLLRMPGKVVTYNIWNRRLKTYMELADTKRIKDILDEGIYPYVETFACV